MNRAPRPAIWLAVGLYLVYVTTSSGGFEVSDAVVRYDTARSWLDGRGGALAPEMGWGSAAVAPDGRVFSFYAPLQSALMVPILLAVRAVPSPGVELSVLETFAISLILFPTASAAAITLLYLALELLGFRRRTALLASLAVGLGSFFWYYARMGQEENLVAFGLALWLYGAARLTAGRRWPATLMALGSVVALASRWAIAPILAVLLLFTAGLLAHCRQRVRPADLAMASLAIIGGLGLLATYNVTRFGEPFETGYGLWHAHAGEPMFHLEGYGEHLAALLVSPYRGLFVYSPVCLLAVAGAYRLRRGPARAVAWGGFAAFVAALLFFPSFRAWTAGHAWGPRFLAGTQVLLAPALAGFFERFTRSGLLIWAFAGAQVLSVLLPGSTEEYVRFNLERERPGYCGVWRAECTAVSQRPARAAAALANTLANRPGVVLDGRPFVAPEVVLGTSDYRTLYWWPVRIAFRMRTIPLWTGLAVCLAGIGASVASLVFAWKATAEPDLQETSR